MNRKTSITILIILGLAIIVGGFWYVKNQTGKEVAVKQKQEQNQEMNNEKENENQKQEEQKNEKEDNKESDFKKIDKNIENNKAKKDKEIKGGVYDGWNEYYNTKYNFSINYPNSMNKDDNYKEDVLDNIIPIVSFDNFSKNRIGYMRDGDLTILIRLYCANEDIDFESYYENKIKYTKEKKQEEIAFMKKESNIILTKKDISYEESEININDYSFKVQYRKYSKTNYIEGGPVIIKDYTGEYRGIIYNITCITPNSKSANNMIKLANKIVRSLKFGNIESL